jgi:parallel beta-helix repeat protein
MLRRTVSGLMLMVLFLGTLGFAFRIQQARASGSITIRADGSIDPPTAPIMTLDNFTYIFTDNFNGSVVVLRSDIIVDGKGFTLQGAGRGSGDGFALYGKNSTITNFNIDGFYSGIEVSGLFSGNNITNNNISNNYMDGVMAWSSYNIIAYNNITQNYNGIDLSDRNSMFKSYNNTVIGNNITRNRYIGISVVDSYNNTLAANNIQYNSWCGIWFARATNNTAAENSLRNNYEKGIWIQYHSNGNAVIANDIIANRWGGIELEDSSNNIIVGNNMLANSFGLGLDESNNNVCYHNNFIDNSNSARARFCVALPISSIGNVPPWTRIPLHLHSVGKASSIVFLS